MIQQVKDYVKKEIDIHLLFILGNDSNDQIRTLNELRTKNGIVWVEARLD